MQGLSRYCIIIVYIKLSTGTLLGYGSEESSPATLRLEGRAAALGLGSYGEYDSPAEEGFEHFFDGYESLLAYCRKRFKNWDKRFKQAGKATR